MPSAERLMAFFIIKDEKKINKQSFNMWLKDTGPLSIKGDTLQIQVKDDVAVRHLKDKYL